MASVGQAYRTAGVRAIWLIHGTFHRNSRRPLKLGSIFRRVVAAVLGQPVEQVFVQLPQTPPHSRSNAFPNADQSQGIVAGERAVNQPDGANPRSAIRLAHRRHLLLVLHRSSH